MYQSTREKLVHTAYELFYNNGFHAVGLDQILEKAGVTKSTLYNHFKSKDELILAVLQWRNATWLGDLRVTLRKHAGDRPRDQLLALFDVLDEVWGTDEYHGCLFIRATAEFPLVHDPIHIVAQDFVRGVGTALRELAGYAGAADPELLSRELLVLMAGAYAHGQMGDPVHAAEMGKRIAKRIVAEHLPEPDVGLKATRRAG